MTLRKVNAIARKELRHLLRDFRSLYLAFVLPLALILLFGYALSLDVDNIAAVVVDHDNTLSSRALIDSLDASAYFQVNHHVPTVEAAVAYLDRGDALMAIVIPPGFARDLNADRDAPVQILIDGSDPNYATLSRGYVTGFFMEYNREQLRTFFERRGLSPIQPPLDPRVRVWFNEDLESRNFIVPGIIAVIIMIVGAILTSLVIAREYENGTMQTLLTLPITAAELLVGKAIPYFCIGLIDILIAVLMGKMLFGIVLKQSFWLLALSSCLYLLVALNLGLFISIATKSQLAANQMAVLTTYLPSLLLSDFVFPVHTMPVILQWLSRIVPATYFIDILNALYLRGMGINAVWPDILILASIFVLLAGVNVRGLRQEGM